MLIGVFPKNICGETTFSSSVAQLINKLVTEECRLAKNVFNEINLTCIVWQRSFSASFGNQRQTFFFEMKKKNLLQLAEREIFIPFYVTFPFLLVLRIKRTKLCK